jgi:hypothetical protein
MPPDKRSGPATTPTRLNAGTLAKGSTNGDPSIGQQLHRRRDAALRLPPLDDGRRDPDLERPTRHSCWECGKDLRLARFHRIDKTRIVCRRCYRDRWAPR